MFRLPEPRLKAPDLRGRPSIPRFRGDGKEIFYLPLDNKIMAVPADADPAFHAGMPVPLFAVHLALGTVHDF